MSLVGDIAEGVLVGLLGVAYKLATKQLTTKDDVGQALARVAVDAGLEAGDLAQYVTDEGARRTEEAVRLGQDAVYGPRP